MVRLSISSLPLLLLLVLASCAPPPPPLPPIFPPKITQFYASPALLPAGESTLLCYGVEFVSSLTLHPGGESLSPAIARCIEKKPTTNTTYTLTAKGKDGHTVVTQTVNVTTGGTRLKFLDLAISAPQVKAGEMVSFCFKAQGAVGVSGGPGRFQKGGLPAGDCLMDQPRKTTTYQLTVRGAGGQTDTERMTVKVLP